MKKTLLATAVLVSLAVLMMAPAQTQPASDDDDVAQLRKQLADQQLRISQLEHAHGKTPASDESGGAASAKPVRTMVLVSINQSDHTGDHAQEIARLQRETESLMNTVNAAADQAASDFGQPLYVGHVRGGVRGWGGAAGGGYATSNVGAVGRQVLADHNVENRYATQHAIKQRQLEALQHADTQPRQIVMGHDGNTIIALETKHNQSTALETITVGDTITWTGTRVSMDNGSESWSVDTIKKVK